MRIDHCCESERQSGVGVTRRGDLSECAENLRCTRGADHNSSWKLPCHRLIAPLATGSRKDQDQGGRGEG